MRESARDSQNPVSQRSLRTNRKRDYKKMLDGDEIFQKTIEDEQIEIRKQFLDQQELE